MFGYAVSCAFCGFTSNLGFVVLKSTACIGIGLDFYAFVPRFLGLTNAFVTV